MDRIVKLWCGYDWSLSRKEYLDTGEALYVTNDGYLALDLTGNNSDFHGALNVQLRGTDAGGLPDMPQQGRPRGEGVL